MDELDLISKAQQGDSEAFEELIGPHFTMLYAYSRAICGDHHLAEDVVQETCMVAFEKMQTFRENADFPKWLRGIARRLSLAGGRKRRRFMELAEESLELTYETDEPSVMDELKKKMLDCLSSLPDRVAKVVNGHYFKHLKIDQLASKLDMKQNTVKTTLFRGRLALQKCIEGKEDKGSSQ